MFQQRPCSSPPTSDVGPTVITSQDTYENCNLSTAKSIFTRVAGQIHALRQRLIRRTSTPGDYKPERVTSRLWRRESLGTPSIAESIPTRDHLERGQHANVSRRGDVQRQDVRLVASSAQQSEVVASPTSSLPATSQLPFTIPGSGDSERLTTSSDSSPIVLRRNTLLVRSVTPLNSMDTSSFASEPSLSGSEGSPSTLSSTTDSTSSSGTTIDTTSFSTSIPPPFESSLTGISSSVYSASASGPTFMTSFDSTSTTESTIENPSISDTSALPSVTTSTTETISDITQVPETSVFTTLSIPPTSTPSPLPSSLSVSSEPVLSSSAPQEPPVSSDVDVSTTSVVTSVPTISAQVPTFSPLPSPRTSSFPLESTADPQPLPTSGPASTEGTVTTVFESSETTVTITSTFVSISTFSDTSVATVTSSAETGVLQMPSYGLTDSIEKIIGASVGGGGSLILAIICAWYFIRRYQRKRQGTDEEAGGPVWTPPLRDETDDKLGGRFPFGFADKIKRTISTRTVVGGEGTQEGKKVGSEKSMESKGGDAATSQRNAGMSRVSHTPESSTAHSHEDLHGIEGSRQEAQGEDDLVEIPLFIGGPSHTGLSNPQPYQTVNLTPSVGEASTRAAEDKYGSIFFGSVATAATRATAHRRASLSGPRPQPTSQRTTRNFSASLDDYAPPFPVASTSSNPESTEESQPQASTSTSAGSRGLLFGWLDRWAGRKATAQDEEAKAESSTSDAQIPNPFKKSIDDEHPTPLPSPSSVPQASTSMVNHRSPLLSFPRGVTGKGYISNAAVASQPVLVNPPSLPAADFAFATPPSPTDSASIVKEGLLHPRLSTMNQYERQPSLGSFKDYEDYSRPIGATALDRQNSSASSSKTH